MAQMETDDLTSTVHSLAVTTASFSDQVTKPKPSRCLGSWDMWPGTCSVASQAFSPGHELKPLLRGTGVKLAVYLRKSFLAPGLPMTKAGPCPGVVPLIEAAASSGCVPPGQGSNPCPGCCFLDLPGSRPLPVPTWLFLFFQAAYWKSRIH